MADPTSVLMAYMRAQKIDPEFRFGQLALGLEVISLIRTLESIPVVNVAEKEGTISCLHTLLREQGLENAYEAYETLAEWRKIRFVPVGNAPVRRGNGDASARQLAGLSSSSSALSSDGRVSVQRGRPHAPLWERPNLDEGVSPRDEQLELTYEAESETPSG